MPPVLSSETRDYARLALYFLTRTTCALTGWHLDPTEACNVAYALCVEVLPHTYCISPLKRFGTVNHHRRTLCLVNMCAILNQCQSPAWMVFLQARLSILR